jgi:hypothetical protein
METPAACQSKKHSGDRQADKETSAVPQEPRGIRRIPGTKSSESRWDSRGDSVPRELRYENLNGLIT